MASCSMDTRDIVVESFNGTVLVSPVSRSLLENLRASRPLNDPSSREKRERESLPEMLADEKLHWNVVLRSYYVSCRPNEECDDAFQPRYKESLDRSL